MKDIEIKGKDGMLAKRKHAIKKTLWLISTARNALIVVLCSVFSFLLYDQEKNIAPFVLTG